MNGSHEAGRARAEAAALGAYDALGNVLHRLARRVDDMLHDGSVPREDIRELRLLATRAIHLLGQAAQLAIGELWGRPVDEALEAMAAEYARLTGVILDLRLEGGVERLPEPVADVVRRVAVEALWNVDRHSRAGVMLLSVVVGEAGTVLEIVDDGVDIPTRQVPVWSSSVDVSMQRIRRTVRSVGGDVSVQALRPRGVRLKVRVPTRSE